MSNLYTCQEVAVRYKVQIETVWAWVRTKKISAIKLGRDYRIREEDLETFEKSRLTVKTEKGSDNQ